jgi:thiamine biosynthesis lipoprotein
MPTDLMTTTKTLEAMTMPFTLKFVMAKSSLLADDTLAATINAVNHSLQQIDQDFSPFKSTSLVRRYQRGDLEANQFTAQFQEVFALASKAQSLTDDAFDPYFDHQRYNPTGLVKGWAIQRIFERELAPLLHTTDLVAVALNGAGDIQMGVRPNHPYTWHVGIEDPADTHQLIHQYVLQNGAIATSGVSQHGQHILTQTSSTDLTQATIIASDLIEADILATSAIAMGQKRFTQFTTHYLTHGLLVDRQQHVTHF